jgi:alpha-mannosidase
MMEWPVFPVLRFGTLHQYFHLAEPLRQQLPLVDHELNMIFTGCYSTQSRIKKGNRRAEEALRSAETLCALSAIELGSPYPKKGLDKAWQNTLFTHFHDILTGSCVQDTREHAMGLYQEALALTNTRSAQALEVLAKAVDTSAIAVEQEPWNRAEGAGVGFGLQGGNIPTQETGRGMTRIFQVFNSTGIDRQENLRLTVWDWPGDLERMYFTDGQGNALPFDPPREEKTYWAHRYFTVPVTVSVPAWGYSTLILREAPAVNCTAAHLYTYQPDRQRFPFPDVLLENEWIEARFDGRTGQLVSLFDKESGTEGLRAGESAGLRYIRSQRNDMSAWVIDRYLSVEPVTELLRFAVLEGKQQPGLITEHRVKNSRITTTVTLGARDRYLKFHFHIDWLEAAAHGEDQPLLTYSVPLADTTGRMLCDVPGGAVWREAQEQDVPCLRYAAPELPGNRCIALVCDSKYGFRLSRGDLSVTLINTAYAPDPYPERGIQDVKVCLLAAPAEPAQLSRLADCCLIPLQYVTNTVHPGTLSHTAGLLQTTGETAVFGHIFLEETRLRLRITEVSGKRCPVTVTHVKATAARATDLFGNVLEVPVSFEKGTAALTLSPFQTLFLELT